MGKKKNGHSPHFEKIKGYYDLYVTSKGEYGWSVAKVRNAVVKGWITEEEFTEITGMVYE